MFARPKTEDPMTGWVRANHFVQIRWCDQKLGKPFVTEVAWRDNDDLKKLLREAMFANNADEFKILSRYAVTVYEMSIGWRGRPSKGLEIQTFVPRDEEGGSHAH